jgi:16S rRNA (cytidine1402-2'-O)-methyltransferase
MGTLYLVATPIGNLQDITLRALDVLRAVSLIAAEDTRSARRLLDHFDVAEGPSGKARLISYNEHNARARTPMLLDALAAGDVAVVSDAGTPGISDPGHHLVVAAVEAGYPVVPIPGASAVVAAVAASGLPSRRFHYLGFLPRQSGARRAALRAAAASGDTLVVYESPHRLRQTLADVLAALGERRIAVCRELTKRYEEIWRGTVSGAIDRFSEPRGEFTLVIEGGVAAEAAGAVDEAGVDQTIAELRAAGTPSKEAVAQLMRRCGLGRRVAYAAWHRAD